MPKLIVLGTAFAVAGEAQENTHMVLVGEKSAALIDCSGSPMVRLSQAGVDPMSLTDLILTHFHPDHVSGVPVLLMDMWLLGRKKALTVYGLDYTLDRIEAVMEAYNWKRWPDFYQVNFYRLPDEDLTPVLETEEWRISASPVHHLIPTIGLRVEFPASRKVLAYSCDTNPCSEVVELARDADILLHESAGDEEGHTAASQAGEIAEKAGAKFLYLIHYTTDVKQHAGLVGDAGANFHGPVSLARDLMELEF